MSLTPAQTFGVNAGTSALSAGFGILGSWLNNKWARENADHDRIENYKYNEMSADSADARTRALYKDLYSPAAQLQQIREAGLSPSVYYANGAGGMTGQTGAQGEGSSGVKQDTYGIPNISPLDMSQIEVNKSIARKNNADANLTEGTTPEQVKAYYLDNENRELRNSYMELENARKQIDLNLIATYGEDEIKKKLTNLDETTKLLIQQTRSAAANADVDEKTINERIKTIYKQNALLAAQIALTKSQKELTDANVKLSNTQVTEICERIAQNWASIGIEKGNLDFKNKQLQAQIKQWGKENGFTSNEQTMAIIEMFLHFTNEQKHILGEYIDSIIPL